MSYVKRARLAAGTTRWERRKVRKDSHVLWRDRHGRRLNWKQIAAEVEEAAQFFWSAKHRKNCRPECPLAGGAVGPSPSRRQNGGVCG